MSHTIITRIAFGAAALAGVAALGACGTTNGSAAPAANSQPGTNTTYTDAGTADSTSQSAPAPAQHGTGTAAHQVKPSAGAKTKSRVNTSSARPCASNQLITKVVNEDSGMGNRHAAIQFTVKPHEVCTLPGRLDMDLIGAHDLVLTNSAPADAPAVTLSDGSSAYVLLHWTSTTGAADQSVPNGVVVDAPSDGHQYLDTIELPWDLGGVDSTPASHTVDAGATTKGTAPAN